MGVYSGPNGSFLSKKLIPQDGLRVNLDAGNIESYSGSGTTWKDLSGNNNDGILVNNVSYSPPITGVISGTLNFDGINDYATINALTDYLNGTPAPEFTIGVWVNFSYLANRTGLWGKNDAIEFGPVNGNGVDLTLWSADTDVSFSYTIGDASLFGWNYIVVTNIGSSNLYLNGNLVASGPTVSGFSNDTFALMSGTWDPIGFRYSGGDVGMFHMYNKALPESEILKIYNATKSRYPTFVSSDLILYLDAAKKSSYPGSGTGWVDLTNKGNNGTLTNGPTFSNINGGALVFDGINDSVEVVDSSSFSFTNKLTVSIWVSSGSLDDYDGFIGKASTGAWTDEWGMYYESNYIYFYINQWDVYRVGYYLGPDINYFPVTNFTATYDGENIKFYRNGTLVDTLPFTGNVITNSSNIGIMRVSVPGVGYYCSGNCHIVQIYDRGLTENEVKQNYKAFRNRFGI